MTITTSVKTIDIVSIKPIKPNRVLSTTHVRDLVESFGATAFATAVVVRPLPEAEYQSAPKFDPVLEWAPWAGQGQAAGLTVCRAC